MKALVKNKHHKWSFTNSYRRTYQRVNVFECKKCGCQKTVTFDSLTHRHIRTVYVNGKEETSKAPDCYQVDNLLF